MSTTAPMAGPPARPAGSRPGPGPVAKILRAPFTRSTRAELLYAIAGLPLGIAGFTFTVASLSAGSNLAITLFCAPIGLPLIALSTLGARGLGSVNRRLARRLLGVQVGTPQPFRPRPGFIGWIRSGLTDAVGWRARAYLVLKFPAALASFVTAVALWAVGLVYIASPLLWIPVHAAVVRHPGAAFVVYGSFHFDTWPKMWLLVAQGVIVLLLAPWLLRAVLLLDRWLVYGLLGPTSLSERVRDLEQTRAHAVDDSAARLRTIERDLHDGAQAQLVAVAMKLGLAREKLGGGTAGTRQQVDVERALELVDTAHRTASEAINELRDLARGIHPPVLDSGLEAALATLASRSAVPVELVADVPQRPSAAIETIAYFCAAELLTNVAKHSGARRAMLEVVHVPGMLRVRVTDDGSGGARLDAGSGLRGLAERIRTVDGRLEISSPSGGPTVATVELPSHA